MCEEFCKALEINMKPGIHCPKETDCKVMVQSMANLDIKREIPESSVVHEQCTVLSETGVSIIYLKYVILHI